jgi:hypothetical protein
LSAHDPLDSILRRAVAHASNPKVKRWFERLLAGDRAEVLPERDGRPVKKKAS